MATRSQAGETLCTVHYNLDSRLPGAMALLEKSFEIGPETPPALPLVRKIIGAPGNPVDPAPSAEGSDQRMHRLMGILGMLTMMALAYLFSTNRRAIRAKTVAWGLGLQIVFAFLVMRWEYGPLHFSIRPATA